MNTLKKCTNNELKTIWIRIGWRIFPRFEDYVVEVRKYETDLKSGKMKLRDLKKENRTKINTVKHV